MVAQEVVRSSSRKIKSSAHGQKDSLEEANTKKKIVKESLEVTGRNSSKERAVKNSKNESDKLRDRTRESGRRSTNGHSKRQDESDTMKTVEKRNSGSSKKNERQKDAVTAEAATAKKETEKESKKRSRSNSLAKSKESTNMDVKEEDNDFSKIESLIFDNQTSNNISKKKQGKHDKDAVSCESSVRSGKSKASHSKRESSKRDAETSSKSKKSGASEKNRESSTTSKSGKRKSSTSHKGKSKVEAEASDSDASDWEEVEETTSQINELEALLADSQDTKILAKESVKIELEAPDVIWGMKKRKKRRTEEEMIEEYLRRHVNRSIKEIYENMHKTHVLCLFAHGRYVNRTLNSDTLLGAALSIITDKKAYPPKRLDMSYLEKFVSWFSRKISFKVEDLEDDYWSISLEAQMTRRFEKKAARSNRELVYMFIIITRALGMNVRLVLSLQPISWKPSADALIKRLKEEKKPAVENKPFEISPSCSKLSRDFKEEVQEKESKPKVKNNRKMLSSDSDIEVPVKKGSKSRSKNSPSCSGINKKKRSSSLSDDENDSDFDPTANLKMGPKAGCVSKKRKSTEGADKGGSKGKKGDNKDGKRKKSEPLLEWAEIYVEEEEKWMCIDVAKAKIHCVPEIEARTPSSSAYITAFDGDLTVKDVTRRYIASWLSNENKMRCSTAWWGKSLRGFRGRRTRLDREEDEEMDLNLRQQPMPKSIGEYKNHPLYALQRHLLKFEAIYPPDETPVGYIRGESVFPRSSIYTLCSRDTWMKEAKTVRVGEEPYKIVKARPKWDRNTCQVIKDRPLEVFGEWQVEDFEPPVASDGKVPRNEYGNVELFKPTMLPRGCIHIPINGLNRVAKKLGIDCAPAMTGFDFHSGWTHPVYEGYVVCEEFKDTLMDAWNEDQAIQAARAEEKRVKRIYDNWKKLIHGMMVKDRVRETYGSFDVPEGEQSGDEESGADKESKDHGKGKIKTTKGAKKRKITQDEIDGERPGFIGHRVSNLKIDLTSSVVEMAKESRKSTMKTSNAVKARVQKTKKNAQASTASKEGDLGNSSDESDEEEKKERIRAILQWGTKAVNKNPNLSDDSDDEDAPAPSCSKFANLPSAWLPKININLPKKSKKTKRKRGDQLSSDDEELSCASSAPSTPEPSGETLLETQPKKRLRRSIKQNKVNYEESDDGDISLGESDVEDKTFNPLKGQPSTLNLSDSN